MIEVPAGLIDPNETAEVCALRELKEETGYVGKVIEGDFGVSPIMFNGMWSVPKLAHVVPTLTCSDPGFCNTNLRMIHVTVDLSLPENQNPQPSLEDNEFIETFSVPLKDLWDECKNLEKKGYAIDARVGTLAEGVECAKRWRL